ncbi:aldo/keto reductase [Dermabacteraceae bacterium P7006]
MSDPIFAPHPPYVPAPDRFEKMPLRACGTSGVKLPAIALGLWHNFGDDKPFQTQRNIIRRAIDLGVSHIDLANNYGPPYGAAEENFGRLMDKDLRPYRNELVLSSKAGWDMWPGPHGFGGSRKYLLTSLEESLQRMRTDYVDIFYHHRPDPDTPLEETMLALHQAVTSGKALYAGVSSYSPELTRKAAAIMRDLGTPLLIHQPSYSLLNRWVEEGEDSLLKTAHEEGMGVIGFSPLAQGMLTNKYLDGVPAESRAGAGKMDREFLREETLSHIRALAKIAEERGQSLAQMAISWVLRDQGDASLTTALIGASSVAQLEDSLAAAQNLDFTAQELAAIDEHAVESGINLWQRATASKN